MSYPLMDTLNSAMFRLSLDELVDLVKQFDQNSVKIRTKSR